MRSDRKGAGGATRSILHFLGSRIFPPNSLEAGVIFSIAPHSRSFRIAGGLQQPVDGLEGDAAVQILPECPSS